MSDRLRDVTSERGGKERGGFVGWLSGRANRKEYWLWMIPLVVLELFLIAFGPIAMFALGAVRLLVWIRRLHDLGWSGWMALLFNFGLVLVNLIIMATLGPQIAVMVSGLIVLAAVIALGCIPGEARPNEFGSPPGQREATDLRATFD